MSLKLTGMTALVLVAAWSAYAKDDADDGVIRDIYALEAKLIDAQYGILGVSPPTSDVYWLPSNAAIPVDLAKFPQAFKKSAYA